MKAKTTWVVIADGDQARIFKHEGPGRGLSPIKDLQFEQDHLKAREIMADKPGRTGTKTAPGAKAAMEYHSDPVAVRERRFVERLAETLERKHAEGAFDRLVIAAAPTALGNLRPALSGALKSVIVAELPKDLTNVSGSKLAEHFEDLIAI